MQMSDTWDNYYFSISGKAIIITIINIDIIITTIIFIPEYGSSGLPWWLSSEESVCNAREVGYGGSIPGLGRFPGEEHPTHSSILSRKLPWTKELGKLSSMGSQSQTQLKQLSKHAWEGQTGFLEGSLASWDFPSTTFPWGCSTWRNAGSHQSPTCPQCVQASCLLLPTPQPQQPLLSKILGSCLCVCSAASNSLQPHGLQPTRFPCPWTFLGRNTGVGCHALFQEIFPT